MLNHPIRVLIVDDEPDRSAGWATEIKAICPAETEVTALTVVAAKELITAAGSRRKCAREDKTHPGCPSIKCDLDTVDILVVDYDLQELLQEGVWSTGLQVAALARAFTTVKTIVLVNQFGTNNFDLTLTKALHSHADFDVGSDQLLNPAFWDRGLAGRYAPWQWGDGAINFTKRFVGAVEWIEQRLDHPVLECLNFRTEQEQNLDGNYISKELWQECLVNPKHTFREMVRESEFLTAKDREAIAPFDDFCARVAAALVMHWLDRWVIPANEVLSDLPHLVSAYPWLLIDINNVSGWQRSVDIHDGFNALLSDVKKYEFAPGLPLSRPVVWRNLVIADPELNEPSGFTYDNFPDLVFCEDTSQFHEFAQSRIFSSKLPTSDPQRFVEMPHRSDDSNSDNKFIDVLYEPSVYFTL